jgi:hypothetical protein
LDSRSGGTQPRNEAHKDQQLLTYAEERELVEWIARLTRVNYPARPSMVRYMAEHICQQRIIVQAETLATLEKFRPTHFFFAILVFEKHFYQTWDPQNQSLPSED